MLDFSVKWLIPLLAGELFSLSGRSLLLGIVSFILFHSVTAAIVYCVRVHYWLRQIRTDCWSYTKNPVTNCLVIVFAWSYCVRCTGDAAKSLTRPRRKQARKLVRITRDFDNIETRAVIKFFFSCKAKAPKEIHDILTETLSCFLPGRAN